MAKAYMRGQFIKLITHIKSDTKAWETMVCREVTETEDRYITNPMVDTKWAWLEAQSMSRQTFFLQ